MRTGETMWVIQGLLAAIFLFAGVMKLVLPIEAMAGPVAFPGLLLRLIGVAEVLGAVGLILPGLLRIHAELTPVAAAGLVIIMIGATVITAIGGPSQRQSYRSSSARSRHRWRTDARGLLG